MSPTAPAKNWSARLAVILGLIVLCRLILLIFAPHCDPSESRYAEMARKMVETGNWVTPQFDYGVPFWAKPPLGIWMSAAGIQFFGANEFGSRIFIFLAALGIVALVARTARREYNATTGWVAAVMLMGSPLFFYCSAAVMTDLALLLGTCLAMLGFREAASGGSKAWGFIFFAGLALGLLAKGPFALVIALPPVAGWILLTGNWRRAWSRLPWISGSVLMLGIAVPWYVLAEMKSPGFLNYFIVGEHFRRFTEKGWKGDLYGKAHPLAPGMIWVFAVAATFPWCLGFLSLPLKRWRALNAWAMEADGRGLYWMLWALWPLVFFTPARNVITTYPLPAVPAIALLLAEIWWRRARSPLPSRFHPLHPVILSVFAVVVGWAMITSLVYPKAAPKSSERELVRSYFRERRAGDQLAYFRGRKFSAEFYAAGMVTQLKTPADLEARLAAPGRLFLAAEPKSLADLPAAVRAQLIPTGRSASSSRLYVERTTPPDPTVHVTASP